MLTSGDDPTERSTHTSRAGGRGQLNFLFHLPFYLPEDIIRRDRHAVVVEDGDELCGAQAELDHHQAAELGVAVLLDDEDSFVSAYELANAIAEW